MSGEYKQIGGMIPAELRADFYRRAGIHGRTVAREMEVAIRHWMSLDVCPIIDMSVPYVPRFEGVADVHR